ncbi:HD domain-containing protein [Niallia circulans]|uniref:HD domain-containing protein n=1 Tax=Niallia circulans TaxID=1397 RepID=A0A553SSD2_NIACI|nr:HD domain-containing phosphohydrolase [Niallia circulans]TRZ39897.1 HD domain-containing protein [Niallia circulans]
MGINNYAYEQNSVHDWIITYKRNSEKQLIDYLTEVCEIQDSDIMEHLTNVQELTRLLTEAYNNKNNRMLDDNFLESIIQLSILHDIGKSRIPEKIVNKPGRLNEFERKIIEMHPLLGVAILKEKTANIHYSSLDLNVAERIILYHHEKWDGTGYPYKIKGNDIPLEARIVAIVDVYDALTAERPYKRAWSNREARQYILEQRGKHFDPNLVDLLLEII